MSASTKPRVSLAAPGVEVVTECTPDGRFETRLNGGRLDGDRFTCAADPDAQHERACRLARTAAWPLRRRRR